MLSDSFFFVCPLLSRHTVTKISDYSLLVHGLRPSRTFRFGKWLVNLSVIVVDPADMIVIMRMKECKGQKRRGKLKEKKREASESLASHTSG